MIGFWSSIQLIIATFDLNFYDSVMSCYVTIFGQELMVFIHFCDYR